MSTFEHPEGLYAFRYPAAWSPRAAVTPGASFAASTADGGLLLEAFAMNVPDERSALSVVTDATLASLREDHPGLRVLSRGPYAAAHPCERTTVSYDERVRGRFRPLETRTDLFVLAKGRHVLGLFVKVVADRHAASGADVEALVQSASIRDRGW
jgi:hypothetical protein